MNEWRLKKKEIADFLSCFHLPFVFVEGSIFWREFLHGIRVIRLGAGVIHPGQEETKIARCVNSIHGRACRFFAARQNEVGAKRVITVCPGLCEMSVGVEWRTNRRRFFE